MPAPTGNQNAIKNYVGMRFGLLTVISHEGWVVRGPQRRPLLKLRCDCGKEVLRQRDTLVQTSSCGCKHGETTKGNTNRRGKGDPELVATEHPTMILIGWAAGIFEGEGSISGNWFERSNGSRVRLIQATVSQKDPWLIDRLRALFGGTVRHQNQSTANKLSPIGRPEMIWVWTLTGARARGFLMTVWSLLSPRRHEQILKGGFSFRDP